MSPEDHEQDASGPWVTVALLGRVRGNRGEITALSFSSRPERHREWREVYLFRDGTWLAGGAPFQVESAWLHDGRPILKFRGVDSISAAEELEGAEVRIPRSERPELPRDEYYESDLVGCEVMERSTGNVLGRVVELQNYGGSGLLTVATAQGGELLVPFARSICPDIDIAGRRILVDLPEGLKELNQK